MDESSRAVVDALSALCEARYALQSFAARVWAEGTSVYVGLKGRRSGQEWSVAEDGCPAGYRMTETLDLPGDRELVFSLTVGFGRDEFRVSGSIETLWEIENGYGGDELLVLPKATADSSVGLIELLRSHVDRMSQYSTVLDDLGLPRKAGS